ncbi:hypothetical protein GLN19_08665, partial [Campylobacter jejuni]|nr:hypothetical protein [Campylobacter jejuni]
MRSKTCITFRKWSDRKRNFSNGYLMLFSKEELDEFLISNEQKHENTPNELKGA